ncbi:RDD family protein [Pontibacter sp. CAU 1760]
MELIPHMQVLYTSSDSKNTLASWGIRGVAFALDLALLLTLVGVVDYFTFSSDEEALLLKPERLLHLVLGWLYFVGAETSFVQATFGKHLLRLQVTSSAGGRISLKQATVRYFTKPLTLVVIVLRYLTGIVPASRHTFHDRLAQAQVVLR